MLIGRKLAELKCKKKTTWSCSCYIYALWVYWLLACNTIKLIQFNHDQQHFSPTLSNSICPHNVWQACSLWWSMNYPKCIKRYVRLYVAELFIVRTCCFWDGKDKRKLIPLMFLWDLLKAGRVVQFKKHFEQGPSRTGPDLNIPPPFKILDFRYQYNKIPISHSNMCRYLIYDKW